MYLDVNDIALDVFACVGQRAGDGAADGEESRDKE
jgi:hypothetical protein